VLPEFIYKNSTIVFNNDTNDLFYIHKLYHIERRSHRNYDIDMIAVSVFH